MKRSFLNMQSGSFNFCLICKASIFLYCLYCAYLGCIYVFSSCMGFSSGENFVIENERPIHFPFQCSTAQAARRNVRPCILHPIPLGVKVVDILRPRPIFSISTPTNPANVLRSGGQQIGCGRPSGYTWPTASRGPRQHPEPTPV